MSSIYKDTRTGIWYVRWYDTGKPRNKSLRTKSKRQARAHQRSFDDAQTLVRHGLRSEYAASSTIGYFIPHYLAHVEAKFKGTQKLQRSTYNRAAAALKALDPYKRLPADRFRPAHLEKAQQALKAAGKARRTINDYINEIRAFFKWTARQQEALVPVHAALTLVEGVRVNDQDVVQPPPVEPVSRGDVDATLRELPDALKALVLVQLYTAARSGELVALRPMDIDRSGDVWTSVAQYHKTAHFGKSRHLYFGPPAQKVLRPLIAAIKRGQYLFSYDGGASHYWPNSYRLAILRACQAAGVPRWTPHRLRHTGRDGDQGQTRPRSGPGLPGALHAPGHPNLR